MERAGRGTTDARLRDMVGRLQSFNARTIAAATTLTENDDLVLVNTTSGSVTVTLPPASNIPGTVFRVKKMVAANTVTIDADGSETIDGSATVAFTTQYQVVAIASVIVTAPATWGWVKIT